MYPQKFLKLEASSSRALDVSRCFKNCAVYDGGFNHIGDLIGVHNGSFYVIPNHGSAYSTNTIMLKLDYRGFIPEMAMHLGVHVAVGGCTGQIVKCGQSTCDLNRFGEKSTSVRIRELSLDLNSLPGGSTVICKPELTGIPP